MFVSKTTDNTSHDLQLSILVSYSGVQLRGYAILYRRFGHFVV